MRALSVYHLESVATTIPYSKPYRRLLYRTDHPVLHLSTVTPASADPVRVDPTRPTRPGRHDEKYIISRSSSVRTVLSCRTHGNTVR